MCHVQSSVSFISYEIITLDYYSFQDGVSCARMASLPYLILELSPYEQFNFKGTFYNFHTSADVVIMYVFLFILVVYSLS